jgi:hypothetical protein
VDGTLDRAGAETYSPPPAPAFPRIGWDESSPDHWSGALDDVAIYPVALTPAQIANHYALGAPAPPPPGLVTLDQVKARLRITSTAEDADLQAITDEAEAQIVGWCSTTERSKAVADTWTDAATVPKVVVAAILVQTAERYRFRGDDTEAMPRPADPGDLSVTVRELLRAYHDPGIA